MCCQDDSAGKILGHTRMKTRIPPWIGPWVEGENWLLKAALSSYLQMCAMTGMQHTHIISKNKNLQRVGAEMAQEKRAGLVICSQQTNQVAQSQGIRCLLLAAAGLELLTGEVCINMFNHAQLDWFLTWFWTLWVNQSYHLY